VRRPYGFGTLLIKAEQSDTSTDRQYL